MPPPGGFRTSLAYNVSGPMLGAFQPSSGVFSPGLPLTPPQPQPTRLLDFNVGINSVITPRGGYADIHSFASLRAFANVEPVRLAIETCKDQIERLDWKIKTVDGKSGKGANDARLKEMAKFFRKPDGVTPFASWLRESLEDLFVLDAPAFEKRRNRGGKLIGLDIVPGDTIKLLVDESGRRPRAPIPAYQQIIKGMVWNNLTSDDLIYAPRNPRPNHLYGLSPVEQIIVTIETVVRRQSAQLGYFTEGNVPAGILNVPEGWGPEAIKTMQDAWDARMEGYLPGKSKLQWVPAGTKYAAFKESPLKDEFDEWLYRIVCFTFSLPPTAFIKQMNRATAEQGADSGKEEGIESRKLWWKRIADDIIQEEFGYEDLEWGWNEDVEVDPLKQAQIDDINLKNGSTCINEVRDGRGKDVVEGGDQAMVYLPTGPVLVKVLVEEALNPPKPAPIPPQLVHAGQTPHDPNAPPPKPGEAAPAPTAAEKPTSDQAAPVAEKIAKASPRTSADRPMAGRAEARARKHIASVLKLVAGDVGAQVEDHLSRFGKADNDHDATPETIANHVAQEIDLSGLADIDILDQLEDVASDAGEGGLEVVMSDVGMEPTTDLTNRVDQAAVAYAKQRAAELVSVDGPENIVDTTRGMIRDTIAKGLEDNIGSRAIADNIQTSQAFSAQRAATIAKTEIRKANTQGQLAGGRAAQAEHGLEIDKSWLTATLGCCDVCQINANQGWIALTERFASGDDGTPGHPNCNCDTAMQARLPSSQKD